MTSICLFLLGTSSKKCDCEIPHGSLAWCSQSLSSYSCDTGYDKTTAWPGWLTCSYSSGQWEPIQWEPMPPPADVAGLCIPKSCPDRIPNGALSQSCSAKVGSTCQYTCDPGYSKVYTDIVCETSTNWSRNPHALCKNDSLQQCPYEVQNGDLDLNCKRRPGDSCTFSCREGYTAQNQKTVYCDTSLRWSQSLQSVCEYSVCPLTIPNGYISTSCSRKNGSICHDYWCDPGYANPSVPVLPDLPSVHVLPDLKCNASGQWQWDTVDGQPCFREEDLCPSQIRNGKIALHCSRQPGSTCTYDCYPGCTKDMSVPWLHCGKDRIWSEDTDFLCTDCPPVTTAPPETFCPVDIPGGHVESSCVRRQYTSCWVSCNLGCSARISLLSCNNGLNWDSAESACDCPNPDYPDFVPPTYSSSTDNHSTAMIAGIVGAIVPVVAFVISCVVFTRNRKRRLNAARCTDARLGGYRNSPETSSTPVWTTSPNHEMNSSNSGITSPSSRITSPNFANPSPETTHSSLQSQPNSGSSPYARLQPPRYNNNNRDFIERSSAYRISPSVPEEPPPSYEELISNPVSFKV